MSEYNTYIANTKAYNMLSESRRYNEPHYTPQAVLDMWGCCRNEFINHYRIIRHYIRINTPHYPLWKIS
jgi:hypothetical protein